MNGELIQPGRGVDFFPRKFVCKKCKERLSYKDKKTGEIKNRPYYKTKVGNYCTDCFVSLVEPKRRI
jgi:hypothetical protein